MRGKTKRATDPALRALIKRGRADSLHKSSMQSMPATITVAISTATISPAGLKSVTTLIWLTIMFSIFFLRYWSARHYKNHMTDPKSADRFLTTFVTLSFLVGISWTSSIVFLADMDKLDDIRNLGIVFILLGVMAGATVYSAGFTLGALGMMAPIAFMIGARFALLGTRTAYILAFDIFVYLVFLVMSSLRAQTSATDMIKLNLQATTLATSLEKEHAETQAAAKRLFQLANHDPLTGLANRVSFLDRLAVRLDEGRSAGRGFCLFLLDLDNFKAINDTLGHSAGDRVLQEVAGRLSSVTDDDRIVARLGGDEFAVLCADAEGVAPDEALRRIAEQMMARVSGPVLLGERSVNVGLSIGIARFPEDGSSAEELLAQADLALYAAKDGGRHRWRRFDGTLLASATMAHDIEHDLPNALADGALEVWFQPQISLRDRRLVGLEGLLRWCHPSYGWIAPPTIVTAALRLRKSEMLTGFVLDQACREIGRLDAAGYRDVVVAVNISPSELDQYALPALLKNAIEAHAIDPGRLELEITEEAFAASATSLATLTALSAMGVRLSIDDFGTGCASIAYLRSLCVNRIKIDKSFVSDFTNRPGDRILVQAIIGIGRSFGIEVLAEGVESLEDAMLFQVYGCQVVQGYHMGRPMALDKLTAWLDARIQEKYDKDTTEAFASAT